MDDPQSYATHVGPSDMSEERTPLLESKQSKRRRFGRFAQRLRRGRTEGNIAATQPPPGLPRQLSSKEHADNERVQNTASGFSLLNELASDSEGGVTAWSPQRGRSSSFGTMPDLRRVPPIQIGADTARTSVQPSHVHISSMAASQREAARTANPKQVIVERVVPVKQKPFFAIC